MAKAAVTAKSCGTCACFVARVFASDEARATALYAGIDTNLGQCRRYPEFQQRHDSDWCGEHREKRA